MKALISVAVLMILGCLGEKGPTQSAKQEDLSIPGPSAMDPLAKREAVEDIENAARTSKLLKCAVEYQEEGRTYRSEEIYSLGVANAKLKYLPEMRKSLKISTIRTCEEARAFIRLYTEYYESMESYEILRQGTPLGVSSVAEPAAAKAGVDSAGGTLNKKGLVDIAQGADGERCMGYMISSREIVTAAHCVMAALASGHSGASHAFLIDYWDPALPAGRRRPLIGPENLAIHVSPAYAGGADTQSDIAVLTRSVAWENTTPEDYLKMYTGTMSQARYNHFYGNGSAVSGAGPSLRPERLSVDWYGEHHYFVLAEGHRLCDEGSGGPFIRDDATDDVVTGHLANVDKGAAGAGRCAEPGKKERATRLGTKVGWIQGLHQASFGTGCATGTTADGHGYMKCF